MNQHGRGGQCLANRVVVGDDKFHPQFGRQCCLLDAGDAAVDRNEQSRLVLVGQRTDGPGIQSVAVVETIGDRVIDLGPGQCQAVPQQAGAGHAVDVVVAVDRDLSAVADCRDDSVGGLIDSRQQRGVVEIGQSG